MAKLPNYYKIHTDGCSVALEPIYEELVSVVRCKDCENYCGFEYCKNGICDVDPVRKRAVYPDDFCSRGERIDNGNL